MDNKADGNVDEIIFQTFFKNNAGKLTFIDVGAARPDFLSNSNFFRNKGWRVISIEPNPHFYKMHKDLGYEIYQYACSDHDEDNVDFNVISAADGVYGESEISFESFSSLGVKPAYQEYAEKINFNIQGNRSTIKIPLRKLDTILAEHAPDLEQIGIISVDVEGWELEVLSGVSLQKFRPKILIIENLFDEAKYRNYLDSRGYVLWRRIYPNDIYVHAPWGMRGISRLFYRVTKRLNG